MQEALKVVRGAVAKKTLLPILAHFQVYGGRIQGGNGRYCIDAPCPELVGWDFCAPAERFLLAVDSCGGEPSLHLTKGGRLTISQGTFRAYLPLMDVDDYPTVSTEHGAEAAMLGDWLPVFRALEPFIGEDASRPWIMGIWLADDGYAYASNNNIIARVPSPWSSLNEQIIIPGFVVEEVLRIGKEPLSISYSDSMVTFFFEDGVWLQSRLLEGQWPESVKQMVVPVEQGVEAAGVLKALLKVRPFCPDPGFPQILLDENGVATSDGEMGARVEGIALPVMRWHAEVLQLMLENAEWVDFSRVPCAWNGGGGPVEGIALPLRD